MMNMNARKDTKGRKDNGVVGEKERSLELMLELEASLSLLFREAGVMLAYFRLLSLTARIV